MSASLASKGIRSKIGVSALILLALIAVFNGCTKTTIHWSPEVGPPDGGKFRGVCSGDFNGDGNLDLAAGIISPGGVVVYWGRGDGTWIYKGKASDLGEIRSMECADFNEDGYDDIVLTTWGDLKGVHVYFSLGNGGWKEAIPPVDSWSYEGLDVGDINCDGHMDIIAANSTSELMGGISVWFGNGAGIFTVDYGTIHGELYKDVALADFNKDNYLDVCATMWGIHAGVEVWYGNGRGDWRKGISPRPDADFWGIDAADLNNDGYPDIVAGTYMEGLTVWYGGPKHQFLKWEHLVRDGSFWGVNIEDFNKDGYNDISATSFDNKGLKVFYNIKANGWRDISNEFQSEERYFGVISKDVNHDGYPDIIAAHPGEGLHVWIQGNYEVFSNCMPVESTDFFTDRKVLETDKERAYSIYFDTAEWVIRPDQVPTLNEIIDLLKTWPVSTIRIEGNCDVRQVDGIVLKSNMELSEKRANTVMQALLDSTKIKSTQFQYVGFGASRPVSADSTQYQLDRRADIYITPKRYKLEKLFKGRDYEALMLNDTYIESVVDSLRVEATENKVFTTISGFPEYKIGPADVLKISLWEGRTLKEYTIPVLVDGTISFSYTNNLKVENLTPSQVRDTLMDEFKEYYREPNVNVEVVEYNARKASILGQERDLQRSDTGPGQYPLTGKTYVVDFISKHGGPTDRADLAQVKVVRANGRTFFLNIYDAMFEGDTKQNIVLDEGDVVYIPLLSVSAQKFFILGEVRNPGVFELTDAVNILEAIMMAGGFTDRASIASVAVIRGDLTKPEVALVNLDKLIHEGDQSENVEIRNKDIVFVSRHFIGDVNYVMSQVLPSLSTLLLFERVR